MSYQIITQMVYNAHTHQIETWQHSNNVWPRTDHFHVLDVRTDEQLKRCSGNTPNCAWIPTGMNSGANPGRNIAPFAASIRNLPGANAGK